MVNSVPGLMAPSPQKLYQCARIALNDLLFRFITAAIRQKSAIRTRCINHPVGRFQRFATSQFLHGSQPYEKRPLDRSKGRKPFLEKRLIHLTPQERRDVELIVNRRMFFAAYPASRVSPRLHGGARFAGLLR